MPVSAGFQLAGVILLFVTLTVAAVTDLLQRKVYNWLTVPAIVLGLTLGYAAGDWGAVSLGEGGYGLVDHVAGLSLGFGLFFIAWFGGKGVGGGDVKLMAAIGAIMGLNFVIGAMFWSTLIGALMAIWLLVWRGKLLWGLRRSLRHALTLKASEAPAEEEQEAKLAIPLGAAIAFGSMLTWFLTEFPDA